MFLQFQTALNIIWDVPPSSRGIGGHVRNRLRTLGMTVALALLFLLFFAADFALGIYRRSLGRSLPFYFAHGVIPFFNLALPFALFSGLLAMIYKLLPDRRDIPWRSAWVGAFVSAGLFTVGRSVIGIYFRFSNVASLFGAANSLVVLLLWLYFTMQILLYGAEFSWALTNPVGGHRSVADQTPPEVVS